MSTENMFPMRFTRKRLVECAGREVSMREHNYPRFVEGKRMSQHTADAELAMMRRIKVILENAPDDLFRD